jgi:hypothetical protein
MSRLVVLSLLIALGLAQVTSAQVPQMKQAVPSRGAIGSEVRVTGLYLDKTKVAEVYLTDQTLDLMVKVLDQTADSIKFRIPPSVKPGRLQLLLKTTGKDALLLEQPLYITVEEPKEAAAPAGKGEVAASSR